jgi:hypothetical protein
MVDDIKRRSALSEAKRRWHNRPKKNAPIAGPTDEEFEELVRRFGPTEATPDMGDYSDAELIAILAPDLEALRRERS